MNVEERQKSRLEVLHRMCNKLDFHLNDEILTYEAITDPAI
jgi:hypothetical protein